MASSKSWQRSVGLMTSDVGHEARRVSEKQRTQEIWVESGGGYSNFRSAWQLDAGSLSRRRLELSQIQTPDPLSCIARWSGKMGLRTDLSELFRSQQSLLYRAWSASPSPTQALHCSSLTCGTIDPRALESSHKRTSPTAEWILIYIHPPHNSLCLIKSRDMSEYIASTCVALFHSLLRN